MTDNEGKPTQNLPFTGDPFADAFILEEQPTTLSISSSERGKVDRSTRRAQVDDGVLEGNGTLERWSPRPPARRVPANRRALQTIRHARRHSETIQRPSNVYSTARRRLDEKLQQRDYTPRTFPLVNQPEPMIGSSTASYSSEALPGLLNPFRNSIEIGEGVGTRNSRRMNRDVVRSGSLRETCQKSQEKNPFDTGSSTSLESGIELPEPAHIPAASTANPFESIEPQTDKLGLVPFCHRRSRNISVTFDPNVDVISNIELRRSEALSPRSRRESRRHLPNFSRPFNDVLEEKRDSITELHSITPQPKHIRFDPDFTFNDLRRQSDSLSLESQERTSLELVDLYAEKRRRPSCVLTNRRASRYSIAEEKVIRAAGKRRLRWTKVFFIIWFILTNAACITVSWVYPKYWYIFVPVILLGNCLNSLMVLNILRWFLWEMLKKLCEPLKLEPTPPLPTHISTTIAMVLACYCESYEEILATMESLQAQEKVDHHKKMFLIICDGMVKGKGATKSTDRVLVEDIFQPEEEHWFPVGYESWDGVINGIYASAGMWRGTPYVCLVKKRNLGKRDGLILVRTLLYKYEHRYRNPESIIGDEFFRWFCDFAESCGIKKFEWLVGVDADTTFNTECIYELHRECLKSPALIGCSGLIQVGFRTGKWNLWNVYQNTEYIRAQLLRRFHQAHGTGKVSCLPGACQIIKICEETCGDQILIDMFGILPDPKSNMIHQIRALAGEDRNYICLIFERYPKTRTTMSINAIAYTDPPNGMMVFLSQRKRWTLSTCANDILIVTKNTMNIFERLCSLADILTWGLPIFIAQTFFLFIRACIFVTNPTFIVCFAIVTMIPLSYAIVATFWGLKGWELRAQYLLGLLMVVAIGQFVTPVVIMYAIWHMDNFSWGKTREVEMDGDPANRPAHSD